MLFVFHISMSPLLRHFGIATKTLLQGKLQADGRPSELLHGEWQLH